MKQIWFCKSGSKCSHQQSLNDHKTAHRIPLSLYTVMCFSSRQVSESLQVRIVAGRPIHCQVPGIDHHLVKWAAVRATLEAAKAIALSHLGALYIAETDERRINRIQQVRVKNIIIHIHVITAAVMENLFPNHNIISILCRPGHICMYYPRIFS